MLRRVVVENYVIFKGRHELDFLGRDGCNFYTFVGENASGKSSLVALIKAASNLQEEGPDFEVLPSSNGESKVVCEFEFSNGAELVKLCEHCHEASSNPQPVSSGLSSWFSDDILKIPSPFYEEINSTCANVETTIQVLAGHRHQPVALPYDSKKNKGPDSDPLCNSQFLYILMEDGILVATKTGGTLTTGFHDPLPAGVNPADWVPQRKFLLNVKEVPYVTEFVAEPPNISGNASCASLDSIFRQAYIPRNTSVHSTDVAMETIVDGDVAMETCEHIRQSSRPPSIQSDEFSHASLATALLGQRPPWRRQSSFGGLAWSNYHELKKIIVAELLRDFPDECFSEIHPLFHEIIGDKSIMFEFNVSAAEPFQVLDNKTHRVMRRIPEGLFSAFIIAALLVKPSSRSVILDEPTRGMHPLQTRRLRNIMMRESVRRRKCIIATTHSPELLDCDRITLIWRFQLLPNGYCQIRRVHGRYSDRELLFIGGAEIREIFFSRHIIWVEGESDKRFIEALLSLFDEGRAGLFKALMLHDGKTPPPEGHGKFLPPEMHDGKTPPPDMHDGKTPPPEMHGGKTPSPLLHGGKISSPEGYNGKFKSLSPVGSPPRSRSPSPSRRGTEAFIRTMLKDPAYQRKYYTEEELNRVQEAVRSCKVLSVGGKMSLWKGAAVCRDLHIPYSIICDLDAIVPNSRENSIQSQFERAEGDWDAAGIPHAKAKLLNEEEAPASKVIDETDHEQIAKLRSCRVVGEVIRYYEHQHYIFVWRPMGGEIEDAVRLTKAQFGKKLWPDMLSEEIKSLILSLIDPRQLLLKNTKDRDAHKGPNLEILRVIYFLIRFFRETLEDLNN